MQLGVRPGADVPEGSFEPGVPVPSARLLSGVDQPLNVRG